MNTFVTSDLHFNHANILLPSYSNRPFPDVNAMDEALVANWNAVVKDDDIVYVLGDCAMNAKRAIPFLERCRGRKRLVRGNHDHDIVKKGAHLWEWVRDYYVATVDMLSEDQLAVLADCPTADVGPKTPQKVVLFHFPVEVWDRRHYGVLHFHGHSHGSMHPSRLIRGRVDVGVDCWGYKPITFEAARARALSYPVHASIDHHRDG